MNVLRHVLAVLLTAAAAFSQSGVRIVRVPERVELPARAGSNLLLEVEVGGDAVSVWLAGDAASRERVALAAIGGGRYQLNLADSRVLSLLPADGDHGELVVCARRDGKLLRSAKVAWARGHGRRDVRCEWVRTDGRRLSAKLGGVVWFDPAAVDRIEVLGMPMPKARAVAVGDKLSLPFARRAADQPFVLQLNDGVRDGLHDAGEVAVDLSHGGDHWSFDLRCVPARLTPKDPEFTILQRRRGEVPGSNGWLVVRLDDITGGQVLLDVTDATGRDVVPQVSVGEGSHVTVKLAGGDYVIVVDRLFNRMIGDDHAELRVVPAKAFTPDPIVALIEKVGAADGVVFVREGVEYPAPMAQALLRARRHAHRGEDLTVEQFIELSSKSTTTGNAYKVRLGDEREISAAEWLRELAKD